MAVELGEPVYLHLDEHVALAAFGENRNVGHRIRRGIKVGVDLVVQRVLHYDAGIRARTRGKRVGGVLELGAHEGIHELLVMQHDVGLAHQKPRGRVGHEDVIAHKRDIVGVKLLLVGRDLLDVMRPQVAHVGRKVEHPVVVAHLTEGAVHRIEKLEVVGVGTLRRLDLHLHEGIARMVVAGVKREGARHNHAHIHAEAGLRAGLLGSERVIDCPKFLVARIAQVHEAASVVSDRGTAPGNRPTAWAARTGADTAAADAARANPARANVRRVQAWLASVGFMADSLGSSTPCVASLVEWLVYHDIWSKMQVFADMLGGDEGSVSEAGRRGPKNLLDDLPDSFNEAQLEALRLSIGKTKEGTNSQLRQWVFRKFIVYSAQTGLYTKTQEYLHGTTADNVTKK